MSPSPYFKARGAAEFLTISERTVRERVAARTIPHRLYGGRLLFIPDELRQHVDGCELEVVRDEAGSRVVRPRERS